MTKESWLLDKIAFPDIFYYFLGDTLRSLIELNIFLIVVAWLFGVSNSYFSSIEGIFIGGALINGMISVVHWYLYLLIIVLLLKILKRKITFKELWIGVFTGIIPYIFYIVPVGIIYYTGITIDPWLNILLNIIFALCKIISTLFVAQGIFLSTNSKHYQAIIIACTLIFLDYIYLIVTI